MGAGISWHIITKDRHHIIPSAVSAVMSQTHRPLELVIVDNSKIPITTNDDMMRLLAVAATQLRVKLQRGSGEGIAQAYQQAMEISEHDTCYRSEDDIWVPSDFLVKLYAWWQRIGPCGGIGSLMIPPHFPTCSLGEHQTEFYRRVIEEMPELGEVWDARDAQQFDIQEGFDDNTYVEVCHLHGGFLYDRKIVQSVGGQSTWTGMTGHREETDLSLRLAAADTGIFFVPQVRAYHLESAGGSRTYGHDKRWAMKMQDERKFQDRLSKIRDKVPCFNGMKVHQYGA